MVTLLGGANRDPEVYRLPDRFERTARNSVTIRGPIHLPVRMARRTPAAVKDI